MPAKTFSLQGGRGPTVGILVAWLDDSYHGSILGGALDAARDRGANLLCFAGGIVGAEGRRDRVFELISPENVDALVILAGSIGNRIGAERMSAYCERFRPLPMCSIALDVEGISSVCIDNDVGMRKVLAHLFLHHKMTRVAFVRGPEANPEAERRFAIYRETLGEAGIPFDPQLVVPGDWQLASGERAVAALFDERRLRVDDVDAIACANDFMALGVLDALEQRGVRVPEQIALVGFDDVEEARFTTPPLTTVRQPLRRQGREAVSLVLDQLRDGPRAQKITLSTELVTRRSCRCFARRGALAGPGALAVATKLGFDALLVGRRQLILADLSRAARGAFSAAGIRLGVAPPQRPHRPAPGGPQGPLRRDLRGHPPPPRRDRRRPLHLLRGRRHPAPPPHLLRRQRARPAPPRGGAPRRHRRAHRQLHGARPGLAAHPRAAPRRLPRPRRLGDAHLRPRRPRPRRRREPARPRHRELLRLRLRARAGGRLDGGSAPEPPG